jgi:hypothetical protein
MERPVWTRSVSAISDMSPPSLTRYVRPVSDG